MPRKKQRANIKFCFLLGKTAAETLTLLQQAYKDDALGKTQVHEWFGRFKKGQMSIEDQPKSGQPSTSRTAEIVGEIEVAVMADRRRGIGEVADLMGVSWSSCQRIIRQDLGLHRVSAKMVLRLLTLEQKETGVDVCRQIKQQLEDDTRLFLEVITGDETWCYGYDPETKQQSSQWKHRGSPRPKKARQVRSAMKAIFLPPGQTVNQDCYIEVLRRLREDVRRKRLTLWRSGARLINHDSAPAHTALRITQFLMKNGMTLLTHAPYLPDLVPFDFFLFPKLKKELKGRPFADVEEVQEKAQPALKGIITHEFADAFVKWETRLERCINVNGNYFEGDGGVLF
uniref:Mos1 transposase HTH domain-containing protein n=1 Tax=Salarias fasciatus TaxID=181472 RepID=A0A672GPV3_SALFA